MSDLISRNKLQQNRPEWLNENCVGREEHNKGWNACNEMWLKTIAEQPTVEAVPVVRCKNCKHWHKDIAWCNKHSHFIDSDGGACHPWESNDWKMFDENNFCSDGELEEQM